MAVEASPAPPVQNIQNRSVGCESPRRQWFQGQHLAPPRLHTGLPQPSPYRRFPYLPLFPLFPFLLSRRFKLYRRADARCVCGPPWPHATRKPRGPRPWLLLLRQRPAFWPCEWRWGLSVPRPAAAVAHHTRWRRAHVLSPPPRFVHHRACLGGARPLTKDTRGGRQLGFRQLASTYCSCCRFFRWRSPRPPPPRPFSPLPLIRGAEAHLPSWRPPWWRPVPSRARRNIANGLVDTRKKEKKRINPLGSGEEYIAEGTPPA